MGYAPWGHKESDTTEHTAHTQITDRQQKCEGRLVNRHNIKIDILIGQKEMPLSFRGTKMQKYKVKRHLE